MSRPCVNKEYTKFEYCKYIKLYENNKLLFIKYIYFNQNKINQCLKIENLYKLF